MSGDFELVGEDEMEPTSSVTFSTLLHEARITEQSKASIFVSYSIFFQMTDRFAR